MVLCMPNVASSAEQIVLRMKQPILYFSPYCGLILCNEKLCVLSFLFPLDAKKICSKDKSPKGNETFQYCEHLQL